MNDPVSTQSTCPSGWRRLWQPRLPAFWLAVLFNVVSTGLVLVDKMFLLPEAARLAVLLLALSNSLLGMWWLGRLWRQTAAPKPHQPVG